MPEYIYDPKLWRMRAEELRAVAEGMANPATRGELLLLAADYDLLAVRSEARQKAREKDSG
jgi:hypothetical protein